PADDFLRAAMSIDGRGIDPVDAGIDGRADRADRIVVVLFAPGELPAAATHRPGAEADRGQLEAALSETSSREMGHVRQAGQRPADAAGVCSRHDQGAPGSRVADARGNAIRRAKARHTRSRPLTGAGTDS